MQNYSSFLSNKLNRLCIDVTEEVPINEANISRHTFICILMFTYAYCGRKSKHCLLFIISMTNNKKSHTMTN